MTNQNSTKENIISRPPIVAILGHIDHGKSTLLDFIRKSKIVSGEAGGITQHIGAYEVIRGDKKITFLDTPGHEAFVSVRDRGAKIADIGILIVSAEDGVKPQTLEALSSIKKSGIPIIVAINKIDSPKANIDLCKASLLENEIYLEGMGGNISYAEISAKTGQGVEELLDLILLTTEIEDFKAEKFGKAFGFVIEANKCKQKGISATLVLKNGTLKKGFFVATTNAYSPVRSITNQENEQLDEITFSTPFSVCGFNDLPIAGDRFDIFENKKDAEEHIKVVVENNKHQVEKNEILDEYTTMIPLIIKTDVVGSKEAIEYELQKNKQENIQIRIVKSETGDISEADLKLALAHQKTIVAGFNVKIDNQAKQIIEREHIPVKVFNIIYEVTDWIKEMAMERRNKITIEEEVGKVKVLKIFGNNKKLQIIGGKVKEGKIETGLMFKLVRRNEEIDKGRIKGVQKSRSEVTMALLDEEFGASIECRTDLAESDMLYIYKIVEK